MLEKNIWNSWVLKSKPNGTMKRKNIDRILITTIIFCTLLIIGILGYVFIHKEPDLPKEVFVLPYVDKGDIEIKPV